MSQPVLLDNTILANFAAVNRPDLVLNLWSTACTTPAVQLEHQMGIASGRFTEDAWQNLPMTELTLTEALFADRLNKRFGAGERTCIAVAYLRHGLFASDDLDARRMAQSYGIPVTGTIGILLLAIRQGALTLAAGNELLKQLIEVGYHPPVTVLDGL
jgi:predicted nucleic acid-binding protein